MHKNLLILFMGFATLGCKGNLPILGYDANGKKIEEYIEEQEYHRYMLTSLTDIQETIVPVMDKADLNTDLDLREITLGLGLKGEAGVGDYFKLAGNIGFRFVFTNK